MTTSPNLSEALISAFKSPNGLKAILESLYLWLVRNGKKFGSRKTIEGVARDVGFEDAICISKVVFEELSKRLCVPLDDSSTNQSLGGEIQQSESVAAIEEINILLRCCIASVSFLEDDQSVLVGRYEFLNRILCMLCSCQKNDSSEGCKTFFHTNPDIHLRLVCRMLEVYMDELIINKPLGKCVRVLSASSSARENMCHCKAFGYFWKVVSAHFLHSFSGVQASEGLVANLILPRQENRETPEVSLTAAVSLLINPALASTPAFLHAHLVSLISDVIGRVAAYDNMGFDLRYVNCYIPAFERSISLYHRQLPKLVKNLLSKDDDSFIKSAIPGAGRQRPFESYVCSAMNERLNSMIKELDCSSCMMISQTKSNMVEISNSYVKKNLHLLDESCRNTASSFLSFLAAKSISAESDDALLHMNGNVPPEDICLFASILKLMSCSLLQTVLYMSSVRNSVHHKTSRGSFQSKEHEILVHIINSFGQYRIQFPVQQLLHDKLEAHFQTVNGSKLILVHFTGLLSICVAGGVEILAKGCLYMMLNLMNLLFFEEGSLNFLSQLVNSGTEHEAPAMVSMLTTPDVDSSGGIQEGRTNRRSSVALASKFRKIQMYCTRKGSDSGLQDEEAGDTMVEGNTCNGREFLKCLNNPHGIPVAYLDEELVDFVECKKGKDYSAWVKNRARYRTRKSQKVAEESWEKKKTTWRSSRRTKKP